MKVIQTIALILTIIGALNWSLWSFFDFNLITSLLGVNTMAARLSYALISFCGLINIGLLFNIWDHD